MKRRAFLKLGLGAGGALFLRWKFGWPLGDGDRILAQGAPSLDPVSMPKFVDPLVIPPVMAPRSTAEGAQGATRYEIAVRQFQQQVLPSGLPMTTVWGYGQAGDPLPGSGDPSTFNFPGFTVEARSNERVQVTWVNHLVDDPDSPDPKYLPHLLPVDQTVHWANPPGPIDSETNELVPYTGPVPIVTHLHGAHTQPESDGYPEAWYLPAASDIGSEYTMQGSRYASAEDGLEGAAVFEYPNDVPALTSWYHDHALGITRLNVYAGLGAFWLIRDDVEDGLGLPGPAPRLGDAPGARYYEIPIVIQDRSFNEDGSLFYPDSRTFFDEYAGPYLPETSVSPIWNPEFFGNSIVVNGRTWPYLEVEPRLYRFRFLNGCNSRFLILKFDQALDFHQIGADGGLLPDAPAVLDQLLLAPAERADVIVDFSNFAPGDNLLLLNTGPDEPFGGLPIDAAALANSETTGQVMQFRIVELTEEGVAGQIPASLPSIVPLESTAPDRYLTLHEEVFLPADIPVEAHLGTVAEGPLSWHDPVTEMPKLGDTETWNLVNLTMDAHPIHLHLVRFRVIERVPLRAMEYDEALMAFHEGGAQGEPPNPEDFVSGEALAPEAWEVGYKDTVIAYPDQMTRIAATFDIPGRFVWHCHILEHEDNEMMRPYEVIDA